MNVLAGYKTYVVSALALAVGVVELIGWDVVAGVDQSNAWTHIQVALSAMFLRAGIAK